MRITHVPAVLMLLVMAFPVQAADAANGEQTPTEKLCADYARKQSVLEKRMRRGMHDWERPRLQKQLDKVRADAARMCKPPANPAGAARP